MEFVSKNAPLQIKTLILLLLASFWVSGCVPSTGPKFTQGMAPPTGKSIVYFYRTNDFMTNTTLPDILDNGNKIISNFSANSYHEYIMEPGRHTFEPKQFGLFKKETVTIDDAKPGETYYVQLKLHIGFIGLTRMASVTALQQIKACYRVYGAGEESTSSPAPSQNNSPSSAIPVSSPVAAESQRPSVKAVSRASQSFLYVNASPVESRIRILNINPKFNQGMALVPGRYHLETSAPGYLTDKRWISLQSGEQNVTITLSPKQTALVPPPAPQVKAEIIAASPEIDSYIKMLRSNDPGQKRDAAKIIYNSYSNDSALLQVANEALLNGYNENTNSKLQIDAMAWLCKAIGRSGQKKYLSTLQQVANATNSSKLKKYALKSAKDLGGM
ncbi:MAG: DUF2846 domain-containing protein [Desulfobulbaceae bacterium]|nr:DUF2846 domain-containing protein [Desulfobulbaceae bacterium]HIJ78954.1 hypothetical protein [Deltaproteobacteria bacterium]